MSLFRSLSRPGAFGSPPSQRRSGNDAGKPGGEEEGDEQLVSGHDNEELAQQHDLRGDGQNAEGEDLGKAGKGSVVTWVF